MLAIARVVITDVGFSGLVSETWRAIAERTNVVGGAGVIIFLMLTRYAVRGAMTVQWVVLLLVSSHLGGLIPELFGGSVYLITVPPFAIAMSFCLVGDFARTNTQLERKFAEVQALSAQVLAQEREKHGYELRQHLFEVENARRRRELEEARMLPLSMLPGTLPRIPGLEVGVAMVRATEVGGDSYDFRALPDASLLVVVGHATGHDGAGTALVVNAVETLFSTLDGDPELASFMARCSEVLCAVHSGTFHVRLALARLRPGGAPVCAAGMPPLTVHRADSGAVEEIMLAGRLLLESSSWLR